MNIEKKIVDIIFDHDVEGLTNWLKNGGDPNFIRESNSCKSTLIQEVLDEIDEPKDNAIVIEMLKILIEYGADINECNNDYQCGPLLKAIKEENLEITELLLEAGANTNIQDEIGTSPLRYVVEIQNVELLKILIKFIDKNDIDKPGGFSGNTPLGTAFEDLNIEIIKVLVENGANPDAIDCDGTKASERIPKNISKNEKHKLLNIIGKKRNPFK